MRVTEIKIVNRTDEELRIKAQITWTLKEQAIIPYDYHKIKKLLVDENMEGVLEIVIEKEEQGEQ